jgi:phosphate:Na+ symporter
VNLEHVEMLGRILAGLGLFFVGIKLLSVNMQQLASLRLRQLISRATSQPILASLLGAAGGFLMQKPSGVIAILSSMQAGGLITLRQAMPIIAWCNIGLANLLTGREEGANVV